MNRILVFQMEKPKQIHINYPPDCVHINDDIEIQWLMNNEQEMDYIELIVSEIYDPSKFWIQLKSESKHLHDLMDEMQ